MRHRAFPGRGREVEDRYLRAAHWIRAAILRRETSEAWCEKAGIGLRRETKQAGEGINTAGGFLVPQELAKAILDIRDMYGAFRRTARLVPMASDSDDVPRRPGGTGAFFLGENASSAAAQVTIDSVNLTPKKIATLLQISNEIDEDSAVDVVDFVANEIAWAFAKLEDQCAFIGDGTSTYGGAHGIATLALDGNHGKAKITAASGHNTFGASGSAIDTTDLGNLMAGVLAAAIPNAAWFCSQTCFALTFCRLTGLGSGFLETRDLDGILTPYYLGFPVILTQALPLVASSLSGSVMLAFGDMYRAAALGERRGITIARSPHRYFDTDQIGVLGTERFTSDIHGMGDNTNAGFIAALVGN